LKNLEKYAIIIILSNGKGKHVMLSRQCDIFEYMEKQEIKIGMKKHYVANTVI